MKTVPVLEVENVDLYIKELKTDKKYLGILQCQDDFDLDEVSHFLQYYNEVFKKENIKVILMASLKGMNFILQELKEE